MERPTWKNTLFSNHTKGHSLGNFIATARGLGYQYIEWNGRIVSTNSDNGMYEIGTSVDFPICAAKELDQPGGVQWHNGLRLILQDIRTMAQDMLQTGTTLLEIVSGRLSNSLETVMLNGDALAQVGSVLSALDERSLRGSDTDGSVVAAVEALRVRVVLALNICKDAHYQQESTV